MMKCDTLPEKWLLLSFLIISVLPVHGQIRLAAFGGVHSARVIEQNSIPDWQNSTGKYYSPITGYQLGLMAEIPIGNKGFYFQPGMAYILKGRQFSKYNDSLTAIATDTVFTQTKLSLGYIEMPMLMTYKIPLGATRKNYFFLSAGPYFSFFFNGTMNEQSRTYSTSKFSEDNIDLPTGRSSGEYNSFDFGLQAKAGFELGNVLLSGYFGHGFTNFYTAPYEGSFHHQVFGASLGIWLNKPIPPPAAQEKDSDFDGVPDKDDACPDQPGLSRWKGCPVPDSDQDGVNDEEDSCKNLAGLPRYHGCPIPDTDGDGINDEEDSCRTLSGNAKYHGCPVPDRDHDGVNDEEDQCPDQPGEKTNAGCPIIRKEIVEEARFEAKNINFKPSSRELTASSFTALDNVVQMLFKNPELTLTIEGYTDNTGSASYNLKLSRMRAETVRKYLVRKGIKPGRIKTKGFGSGHPIADNQSAEGRSLNRRVEFRLERSSPPGRNQ